MGTDASSQPGAKLIGGEYRKEGNCFATSVFLHSWRSMAWSGWLSVVLGGMKVFLQHGSFRLSQAESHIAHLFPACFSPPIKFALFKGNSLVCHF